MGGRPEIARVHGEMGWTALAAGAPAAARRSFRLAVVAHEEVGAQSPVGKRSKEECAAIGDAPLESRWRGYLSEYRTAVLAMGQPGQLATCSA